MVSARSGKTAGGGTQEKNSSDDLHEIARQDGKLGSLIRVGAGQDSPNHFDAFSLAAVFCDLIASRDAFFCSLATGHVVFFK
jgi:hypothetical protein